MLLFFFLWLPCSSYDASYYRLRDGVDHACQPDHVSQDSDMISSQPLTRVWPRLEQGPCSTFACSPGDSS